jgi:hypothetical protein
MVKVTSQRLSLRPRAFLLASPAGGRKQEAREAISFFNKSDCRAPLGLAMMVSFMLGIFFSGCSAPPAQIPDIPKDHPANKFYQAAHQGMLSDKVCRDNLGDPTIPAGKIQKSEGYTKTGELTAGVFRFRENATGKEYLGVSFLQYSGFLQIPKVCTWDENSG